MLACYIYIQWIYTFLPLKHGEFSSLPNVIGSIARHGLRGWRFKRLVPSMIPSVIVHSKLACTCCKRFVRINFNMSEEALRCPPPRWHEKNARGTQNSATRARRNRTEVNKERPKGDLYLQKARQ